MWTFLWVGICEFVVIIDSTCWLQIVIALSCMMAFCLNYTIFLNTTLNSALTQTMCGNLKVCSRIIILISQFHLYTLGQFISSLESMRQKSKKWKWIQTGSGHCIDWLDLVRWAAIWLGAFWRLSSFDGSLQLSLLLYLCFDRSFIQVHENKKLIVLVSFRNAVW